jgi:cation transport protein ChaC
MAVPSYFAKSIPYLFAYGSLVNDKTRPSNSVGIPAQVKGYSRSWRHPIHLNGMCVCGVTVYKESGGLLDGLLILSDPEYQSKLLSTREPGYSITTIDTEAVIAPFLTSIGRPVDILVSDPKKTPTDMDEEWVILRTYLDAILYGYFIRFGEEGVSRFLTSFVDWEFPILNDRVAPRYPRHQQIGADLLGFFDQTVEHFVGKVRQIDA